MPSEVLFSQVRKMLEVKGYRLDRIKGSHHVFEKPGCRPAIIPGHRGKVKYDYVRKIERIG